MRFKNEITPQTAQGEGTGIISNLVPKGHKLYHLFKFIGNNYGDNPENILHAIDAIFNIDKGIKALFRQNKRPSFKNSLTTLRYALPAAFYGLELGYKIKKYIKDIKDLDVSEYEKRREKIKSILDLDSKTDLYKYECTQINDDILNWLLESPETSTYKILGYYNGLTFEKLEKVKTDGEKSHLGILIELNKSKILLEVILREYAGMAFIDEILFIAGENSFTENAVKLFEMQIIKDFILTFNISENVLEIRRGLFSKRRTKVEEKINQFDVIPLIKEIRKVLKYKRKKGIAFVGKQGTGKSVIIKKLEELMTDTIIVKVGPQEFLSSASIKHVFALIKTIQPALVIIEDLDAFDFKEKNERVGTFINEIDDSNNDLNIFILVTINDTDMIHRTIIDRPGRFDEIIEIRPPQSPVEIYEVIKSKYDKLKHFYNEFENIPFPEYKDIIPDLFKRCLKNNFTQAELTCGIIEKLFLNKDDPNNIDFNIEIEKAIITFEKSKHTLKTYSFNEAIEETNGDPYKDKECVVPMAAGRAY